MSKNRLKIDFDCFSYVLDDLERLGASLNKPVEQSLIKSRNIINDKVKIAMVKHKRTGKTEASIKNDTVKWESQKASIGIGFDIKNGGLPSIFLMYGTPRMKKDTKLYNAIYGKGTREEISNEQKKIFTKYLDEVMKSK